MPSPRKRRWFQFKLRTLLIAVALIGAVAGYFAREASIVWARRGWLKSKPNGVALPANFWYFRTFMGNLSLQFPANPKNGPGVVRRILGDVPRTGVVVQSHAKATEAEALFPEADIWLQPQ